MAADVPDPDDTTSILWFRPHWLFPEIATLIASPSFCIGSFTDYVGQLTANHFPNQLLVSFGGQNNSTVNSTIPSGFLLHTILAFSSAASVPFPLLILLV